MHIVCLQFPSQLLFRQVDKMKSGITFLDFNGLFRILGNFDFVLSIASNDHELKYQYQHELFHEFSLKGFT